MLAAGRRKMGTTGGRNMPRSESTGSGRTYIYIHRNKVPAESGERRGARGACSTCCAHGGGGVPE